MDPIDDDLSDLFGTTPDPLAAPPDLTPRVLRLHAAAVWVLRAHGWVPTGRVFYTPEEWEALGHPVAGADLILVTDLPEAIGPYDALERALSNLGAGLLRLEYGQWAVFPTNF